MVTEKIFTGMTTLVILMGVSTAFAYTNCSDSTGTNRYEDNNYPGGPMPQPTTVVDDAKIYLNGQLASESKTLYNGTKTEGPWAAIFSATTKTVLNSSSNWVQDYAIKVSVDPTQTLPPSHIFWMICHQDNTPVP